MLETISFNGLNPSFMSLHFSRDEQMSYHYWWTQNAHLLSSLYQAKTALWSIETMFKTYQRKGDNIDVAADVFFRENAILAKLTERLHPYIWLLLKSPSYNQYHHCGLESLNRGSLSGDARLLVHRTRSELELKVTLFDFGHFKLRTPQLIYKALL